MNDIFGNPINPTPQMFNHNAFLPHYDIIKVNGEAGAKNFRMGPNSNALLLDETGAIIWHAQTPYDFSPHRTATPVDVNDLATRVAHLEETLNAIQSNTQFNKQSRRNKQQPTESADNAEH